MKTYIIKTNQNYPELIAKVTVDNFGTQHVEIEREYLDGSRGVIKTTEFNEGEHVNESVIQTWVRSWFK